jgi:hypothetical protein
VLALGDVREGYISPTYRRNHKDVGPRFVIDHTLLALRPLGTQAPVMIAATAPRQPSGQVVRIPRDWGRLAGVSERRLFFEAEDGTIRQMPVRCEVCTFFRN